MKSASELRELARTAGRPKRLSSSGYSRFFPAADDMRALGWTTRAIAQWFINIGEHPADKFDALKQALLRHFRRSAQ